MSGVTPASQPHPQLRNQPFPQSLQGFRVEGFAEDGIIIAAGD
jgi:hypothetical protein